MSILKLNILEQCRVSFPTQNGLEKIKNLGTFRLFHSFLEPPQFGNDTIGITDTDDTPSFFDTDISSNDVTSKQNDVGQTSIYG